MNRYTYGKPVEGTVKIRAKNEFWYRPWNFHGEEPMVEQSLTLVQSHDSKYMYMEEQ